MLTADNLVASLSVIAPYFADQSYDPESQLYLLGSDFRYAINVYTANNTVASIKIRHCQQSPFRNSPHQKTADAKEGIIPLPMVLLWLKAILI